MAVEPHQALRPGTAPPAVHAARTVRGRWPDTLTKIMEADVSLALWDRRLPVELEDWLLSLPAQCLPSGRVLVTQESLSEAVGAVLLASGTPCGAQAAALVDDIRDLAARYAVLADCNIVDVQLEVIRHDACWKFHRDRVPLRLLTTYLGPGTQVVAPDHADQALARQKAYDGPITSIPLGAVAAFKGDRDGAGTDPVHRSPPIAGTGQIRLVLCLNQPSAASPEIWPHR